MIVKVHSEEELLMIAKEALHILVNLRHNSKAWERDYGAALKEAKKYWEGKADVFLNELQVKRSGRVNDVHITIKDNDATDLGKEK